MSDVSLMLLRHFATASNDPDARRFTGWIDVDLAPGSYRQGVALGKKLAGRGITFMHGVTSTLRRAERSLAAVIDGHGHIMCSVDRDERLNERKYGVLQGMLHREAIERYGAAKVQAWRRGYQDRPPEGESLEDTRDRVVSCWKERLAPIIRRGWPTLVVAHGNSLRALYMHLSDLDPVAMESVEFEAGELMLCTLDTETLQLTNMVRL